MGFSRAMLVSGRVVFQVFAKYTQVMDTSAWPFEMDLLSLSNWRVFLREKIAQKRRKFGKSLFFGFTKMLGRYQKGKQIGLKFRIFETKSQELIGRKKRPSSFLYHAVGQKKWLPNGSCSSQVVFF